MTTFTIVLYTYNRLHLLKDAIMSILNQTYPHLELIIVNNGSTDGTQQYIEHITDQRVKIKTIEKNEGVLPEILFEECEGDYILPFFGDDDVLTHKALETVAGIFSSDPSIDNLSVGCVSFNLDTREFNTNELNAFSGELQVLDRKKEFFRFVNSWGIGRKTTSKSFGKAHSSASIFSRGVLLTTKKEQGEIFVKPFGDVGLIGTLLYAKKVCYLSLPLVVIGIHEKREMAMSRLSNRRLCDKLSDTLVYSPVKTATFFSLGIESHLKVIHYNNLENCYDWSLRPKFHIAHMMYLLCDKRWDGRTIKDLLEALPLAFKSVFHYFFHSLFGSPVSCIKMAYSLIKGKPSKKNMKSFSGVLEMAGWIALHPDDQKI
jgi:glycosyltransferase involved in cell wall biosynthesis